MAPVGMLDLLRASAGTLLALGACAKEPMGSDVSRARPTSASTSVHPPTPTALATAAGGGATTSVGSTGAAPAACTTNADCRGGGVCNCRGCAPGQPCAQIVDACGDCGKRKMVGVCLRDCEGG
jgi:hypothetical protein